MEIESEEEFAILWNIGIFQKINEQVDGLIDDYEEYFFDAGKMPKVLVAINEVKSAGELSDSVESFMTSLSSMVLEASSIQKPLLFVF